MPINAHNSRRRAFDPAARMAKVSRATPKSGRHSFISWQIAAGEYVVDVARIAGHAVNVCLTHYAREFEHARHGERVDMETAVITARRTVSGSGVPIVCPPSNVVPLRRPASGTRKPALAGILRGVKLLGLDSNQQPFD
jgi:hypothetical protein